jgi:hypothetical protein
MNAGPAISGVSASSFPAQAANKVRRNSSNAASDRLVSRENGRAVKMGPIG